MNLIETLWDYVNDKSGHCHEYLGTPSLSDADLQTVRRFLFATMDETRLQYAADFSRIILNQEDMLDADHFREGVLKREASGEISYQKQRDHSAHSAYNWLLGWYIYSHSTAVRDAVTVHVDRRLVCWIDDKPTPTSLFGLAWQFASLLHDIGYIFEGSLSMLDPKTHSEQAVIGTRIARDFFESRFWIDNDVSSVFDRQILQALTGVSPPAFQDGQSIARIADTLRGLGNLEELTKELRGKLQNTKYAGIRDWNPTNPLRVLPSDSFDIWDLHFRSFGQDRAAMRIRCAQRVFESHVFKGLAKLGLRILDHGICSGLLQLLYTTFYYRIRFGLEQSKPSAGHEADIVIAFRNRAPKYDPRFWWTGILWGTGATAIHNIQQMKEPWVGTDAPGNLTLDEDPVAYLGVLVDCLQEWDRYSVVPDTVLRNLSPVQGVDMGLKVEFDKVVITFPEQRRADKVREELDNALEGWTAIVEVLPPARPKP